jgi:uncharacterized membrane protein
MKITLSLIFTFIFLAGVTQAHVGHKKKKKESTQVASDTVKVNSLAHEDVQGDTVHHHEEGMTSDQSKVTADLDDFPTLHPLIVHFAIVLIIVAAGLNLLNLFLMKREVAWITAGILAVGFISVWFASGKFHPHTHGISEHAQLVLDQHDKWADWTKYSAFIALLLQIANLFLFKTKRWAAAIVGLVLVISAYSVSRAGHYGSQLVHIEGIGPKGEFLEMEHEH